jgi:PAS domain S-box-containing protein
MDRNLPIDVELKTSEVNHMHGKDEQTPNDKALFRFIFETIPAAIVITNSKGKVVGSNQAFQKMLGYSAKELFGMHWKKFTHPDDMPLVISLWEEMNERKKRHIYCQIRCKGKHGDLIWVEFAASMMHGVTFEEQLFIGLGLNISRDKYEEVRFRSIFDATNVGMALVDLEGRPLEANRALQEMLGYSDEELRLMTTIKLTHPDDVHEEKAIYKRFSEGEIESAKAEKRYCHKDGSIIWGNVTGALLRTPEGEPQFIISTIENITQRKNAEKELFAYQEQIRSLASQLTLAEERERRHISLYLHDHVAQGLSFCKMKLGTLQKSPPSSGFAESLDEILKLIEEAVQDIRLVILELSPPVLYELGLEAALEWLADQMEERYNLMTKIQQDGQPKPLDSDLRSVLFHAVRESLINVAKHAHTLKARVSIRREGNNICIKVEDQGIGFNVSDVRYESYGNNRFGLFNIKERLGYFGGKFAIESEPGIGTRITLIAPLKAVEEEACYGK